jgi:hypothetical protein
LGWCRLGGRSFGYALRALLRMTAKNMQRQRPIQGSFGCAQDDKYIVNNYK